MPQRPSRVVIVAGCGGGADKGEMVPTGRESCKVDGTAAARIRVICSGVAVVASLPVLLLPGPELHVLW